MKKSFYCEVSESIAKYNPVSKTTKKITSSKTAVEACRELYDGDIYDIERMYVVFLNRANLVIHTMLLSMGGMTGTVVDLRKLFREALICKATGIIITHNHPSGTDQPSNADIDITEKIKSAGKIMDINLVDHIIIAGEESYYSFADSGRLF